MNKINENKDRKSTGWKLLERVKATQLKSHKFELDQKKIIAVKSPRRYILSKHNKDNSMHSLKRNKTRQINI